MGKKIDGVFGYSYFPKPLDEIEFIETGEKWQVYQYARKTNCPYSDINDILHQLLHLGQIKVFRNGIELNLEYLPYVTNRRYYD